MRLFDKRYANVRKMIIDPILAQVQDEIPPHKWGQPKLIVELAVLAQLCCTNASMKLMEGEERAQVVKHLFERNMHAHIGENLEAYVKVGSQTGGLALHVSLRAAFRGLLYFFLDAFYEPPPPPDNDQLGQGIDAWLLEQSPVRGIDVHELRRDLGPISTCCAEVATLAICSAQLVSLR